MDLIQKLLQKDPSQRPNLEQIKQHNWFKDSDWNSIIAHQEKAEILPVIKHDLTL